MSQKSILLSKQEVRQQLKIIIKKIIIILYNLYKTQIHKLNYLIKKRKCYIYIYIYIKNSVIPQH